MEAFDLASVEEGTVISIQIIFSHLPPLKLRLRSLARIQSDITTALIGSSASWHVSRKEKWKQDAFPAARKNQHPKKRGKHCAEQRGTAFWWWQRTLEMSHLVESWNSLEHKKALREKDRDVIYLFQPWFMETFSVFPH